MQIAFFPVSLESISPTLGLEEALAALCGNGFIRDHEMWTGTGPSGEVVIKWRASGKLLSAAEYEPIAREQIVRFGTAGRLLLSALKEGVVQAFVWSPQQRTAFHVPRYYWFNAGVVDLTRPFAGLEQASAADDSMVGQPVWLSEAKFRAWLDAGRGRLEAVIASEIEKPKAKRRTRPGPKWLPALRTMMEKEGERLDDWRKTRESIAPEFPTAAFFRRKLEAMNWPAEHKPRRTTVEYHYNAIREELGY